MSENIWPGTYEYRLNRNQENPLILKIRVRTVCKKPLRLIFALRIDDLSVSAQGCFIPRLFIFRLRVLLGIPGIFAVIFRQRLGNKAFFKRSQRFAQV